MLNSLLGSLLAACYLWGSPCGPYGLPAAPLRPSRGRYRGPACALLWVCVVWSTRPQRSQLIRLGPGLGQAQRTSAFVEESVASRFVRVFGPRDRPVCFLVSLLAASSQSWQSWRLEERHTRDPPGPGCARFQSLSGAAGTPAKPIYNRVMAKKTKAKAPAKKPSAAKAKKPSASSSGSVVEVEACKS